MTQSKVAIVLQAGTGNHEQTARALHSLIYAKELQERGNEVRLVFDGAGTEWLARWTEPQEGQDGQLASFFQEVKQAGLVYSVCDFCAGAFQVRDKLVAREEPLVGQYMNHPSLASLVDEGFQVWIL